MQEEIAGFRSEEMILSSLRPSAIEIQDVKDFYHFTGDTLRSCTYADVRRITEQLAVTMQYKSEVSFDDLYTEFNKATDSLRDTFGGLINQCECITKLVNMLYDPDLQSVLKFDSLRLADLASQVLMALKLLAAEPSVINITLVFTCFLSKLDVSSEMRAQCQSFVQDCVLSSLAAIKSLGYKSEGALNDFVGTMTSLCSTTKDFIDDRVVDITLTFLARLVAFWATVSGGFEEQDFDISSLPKIVTKMREVASEGGDLIECILAAYTWVTENYMAVFSGDFSKFFFGKADVQAFETKISKIKKIYPLVQNGSWDVLKEEYGYTESSYALEIDALLKQGSIMMKKAKVAQLPAYKRYMDELREIQVDQQLKKAQIQTKITAFGVCYVGSSGIGKSLLMDNTSRTLIRAAGENPTSEKIVTGQMSDKFDSNEQPHHLSIQYDDVANNSANENFDKLLNAVNSQSRPFLKAGVDEKGIMFPGNVACVISTNVPGINAHRSNCPDSICRRFLHIEVSIKDELIDEVCVPGTRRVCSEKAVKNGAPRMDIWKFSVYEFISFDFNPDNIPSGTKVWNKMLVRELQWSTKPLAEQTYWDLAKFLGERAKRHFASQASVLAVMKQQQKVEYCIECCVPCTICSCDMKSEFVVFDTDISLARVAAMYTDLCSCLDTSFTSFKWRATWAAATAFAPINIKNTLYRSFGASLVLSLALSSNIWFIFTFVMLCTTATYFSFVWYAYYKLKRRLATQFGVLTQLAEESANLIREHRMKLFVGAGMITFAYTLYRLFRPTSQQMSYREALPETLRESWLRAEAAKTTPLDNLLPHLKKDLGQIIVKSGDKESTCLCFPIESNFYLTAAHILPQQGEFEIKIVHENALTPTAAKQKLSQAHVYRFKGKDLAMIQVPSAIPRRGYKDYLLKSETLLGNQCVKIVTMDVTTKVRQVTDTQMQCSWTYFKQSMSTDRATIFKPYSYAYDPGTRDGMCGSLVVDYSKSILYGFHVAGNGKRGICSTLFAEDVDEAIGHFNGFVPLNKGDLQIGDRKLEKSEGMCGLKVGDPAHDKPVAEHNLYTEGVLPDGGATFKDPYRKHPFYKDVVDVFGPHKYAPPQGVNDDFHKRKALTKLSSPNQEFSLSEIDFVVKDYMDPIIKIIKAMKPEDRRELSRPLSLNEALDGIGEPCLGGIDNSTAVGFPFRGKKKDFLARDPRDRDIPLTPRELIVRHEIDIVEEMEEMRIRYRAGISCRPLFKCSIKTNELLPVEKYKARVFMGSNFPFLLLCRQELAPIIRFIARNKQLCETAKGINMDSVEAEQLFNHLNVEGGKRVVALDYAAYDQTMSAQMTSAVAGMMLDIMRHLGCNGDQIQMARGLLTDIVYPNLHYFGTVLQLANSDPSGNPITTELNGMVNSLYLRSFFFRIYPEWKGYISYRDAVHTMTYGDDNINGVKYKFRKFNGINIVEEGRKVGLDITMADKGAKVVDFTDIYNSDFLKRKFRYCPDMKRIRAPLAKDSITKSLYWMKKTSPQSPEVLFADNVDGMQRRASQHGREYFKDIHDGLRTIAERNNVSGICRWWDYDELIKHDKELYYDKYDGSTRHQEVYLDLEGFRSEGYFVSPSPPKRDWTLLGYLFNFVFDTVLAFKPFALTGRAAELGISMYGYAGLVSVFTLLSNLVIPMTSSTSLTIWLYSCQKEGKRVLANLFLRNNNDIVRKQPFAIWLEGNPGTGKTFACLLLIKRLIPDIKRHEIIILNEEDDFQSELRSHHRVIIMDDIGNTLSVREDGSPLRRPLDFINNAPRRALNPEAELKGAIVINPELVILTSNRSAHCCATLNSVCPSSLFRRWRRVELIKKGNFTHSMDTTKWSFRLYDKMVHHPMTDKSGEKYDPFRYDLTNPEIVDYNEFCGLMEQEFVKMNKEQDDLVKTVNNLFDGKPRRTLPRIFSDFRRVQLECYTWRELFMSYTCETAHRAKSVIQSARVKFQLFCDLPVFSHRYKSESEEVKGTLHGSEELYRDVRLFLISKELEKLQPVTDIADLKRQLLRAAEIVDRRGITNIPLDYPGLFVKPMRFSPHSGTEAEAIPPSPTSEPVMSPLWAHQHPILSSIIYILFFVPCTIYWCITDFLIRRGWVQPEYRSESRLNTFVLPTMVQDAIVRHHRDCDYGALITTDYFVTLSQSCWYVPFTPVGVEFIKHFIAIEHTNHGACIDWHWYHSYYSSEEIKQAYQDICESRAAVIDTGFTPQGGLISTVLEIADTMPLTLKYVQKYSDVVVARFLCRNEEALRLYAQSDVDLWNRAMPLSLDDFSTMNAHRECSNDKFAISEHLIALCALHNFGIYVNTMSKPRVLKRLLKVSKDEQGEEVARNVVIVDEHDYAVIDILKKVDDKLVLIQVRPDYGISARKRAQEVRSFLKRRGVPVTPKFYSDAGNIVCSA